METTMAHKQVRRTRSRTRTTLVLTTIATACTNQKESVSTIDYPTNAGWFRGRSPSKYRVPIDNPKNDS